MALLIERCASQGVAKRGKRRGILMARVDGDICFPADPRTRGLQREAPAAGARRVRARARRSPAGCPFTVFDAAMEFFELRGGHLSPTTLREHADNYRLEDPPTSPGRPGSPGRRSTFSRWMPAPPVTFRSGLICLSIGLPSLEGRGFKVANDTHGPPMDPDTADRRASAAGEEAARAFLARRFPSLAKAPLSETRVCQYENSSNGHLVIDRHPVLDNVWLVGCGSGHGFKHGPAVGSHIAELVAGTAKPREPFLIATKLRQQDRAVQ